MAEKVDIRAKMAAAISNAILDHGLDVGRGEISVDPTEARQALITSLAMWIEADSRCQSPRGLREMTEVAIKELKFQTRNLRKRLDETGERVWDARPVIFN